MSKKPQAMDHDTFNERLGAAKENTAKAQELARDLGIKERTKLNHIQLIKAIEMAEPTDDHAAM
jgi:hypothetical protein